MRPLCVAALWLALGVALGFIYGRRVSHSDHYLLSYKQLQEPKNSSRHAISSYDEDVLAKSPESTNPHDQSQYDDDIPEPTTQAPPTATAAAVSSVTPSLDALDRHMMLALGLSNLDQLQQRLYGHIYNAQNAKQADAYLSVVLKPIVKTICEVGFASGHSTVVYLAAKSDTRVISFDDAAKADVVDAAERFINREYPGRLTLIRGDSMSTISAFARENPAVKCDLISIGENACIACVILRHAAFFGWQMEPTMISFHGQTSARLGN